MTTENEKKCGIATGAPTREQREALSASFRIGEDEPTEDEKDREIADLRAALATERERAGKTRERIERDLQLGGNTPEWREVVACVDAFRAVMLEKLAKNQHKGNRHGWYYDHPIALLKRVREEVAELAEEVNRWTDADALVREAADVANMAMMVADSGRALMRVGDFNAALAPLTDSDGRKP